MDGYVSSNPIEPPHYDFPSSTHRVHWEHYQTQTKLLTLHKVVTSTDESMKIPTLQLQGDTSDPTHKLRGGA